MNSLPGIKRCLKSFAKVVIGLVVFVSFTALMNSNVIAANKSTKPDKAGFTKSTEITMQDYSMSVPTYWNSDIYDKNAYRAYCNNDDFAMLIIDVDDDMSDFSFENKADRTRFIDAMVTAEDENAKLIESDYRKYGNLQGAFAIFDFEMEVLDAMWQCE